MATDDGTDKIARKAGRPSKAELAARAAQAAASEEATAAVGAIRGNGAGTPAEAAVDAPAPASGPSGGNGAASPELQASPASVFDDLEKIRLDPASAGLVGVREILRHVPVRKPDRDVFFRVHPSPDMQLTTGVYIDRTEREVFFVAPALRSELVGEWRPVLLVTTITKQGVLLLWPIALPDEGGRRNAWADSARDCCEAAKTRWVRLVPDMALGSYRIYEAEGQLSEPVWPDKSFAELLKLGFKDRIVDTSDHPVIKRLRGLV